MPPARFHPVEYPQPSIETLSCSKDFGYTACSLTSQSTFAVSLDAESPGRSLLNGRRRHSGFPPVKVLWQREGVQRRKTVHSTVQDVTWYHLRQPASQKKLAAKTVNRGLRQHLINPLDIDKIFIDICLQILWTESR